MTDRLGFPPAPSIGGDYYELSDWLEKVIAYYDGIEGGQAREDALMDSPHQIREEFERVNTPRD